MWFHLHRLVPGGVEEGWRKGGGGGEGVVLEKTGWPTAHCGIDFAV